MSGAELRSNSLGTSRRAKEVPEEAKSNHPSATVADAAAIWAVRSRERIVRELEAFFNDKSIAPALRAKVVDLLVNQDAEMFDIANLVRQEGLSIASNVKLTQDSIQRLHRDLAALIGTDTKDELFSFRWTQIFIPLTQNFAERCANAGVPLSTATFTAMNRTFSRNAPSSPIPDQPLPGMEAATQAAQIRLNEFHDQAAMAEAQKALTPEQLRVFKQMWSEHPHVGPPFTTGRR